MQTRLVGVLEGCLAFFARDGILQLQAGFPMIELSLGGFWLELVGSLQVSEVETDIETRVVLILCPRVSEVMPLAN